MFFKSDSQYNKTLRLFAVALLSVFLVACGGEETESTATNTSQSQNEENNGGEQPDIQVVAISSNPQTQTVNENESLTFSVTASGDELAYQWRKDGQSIQGATQPTLVITSAADSDNGVYDVVVSNSISTATSLSALLTVQNTQPVLSSIQLSWDIPMQREDGSDLALYEIDGYVVAYGTSAQDLNSAVNIVGGGETSIIIEDLPANTYYFAIATIDSDSVQGAYSGVIAQSVM